MSVLERTIEDLPLAAAATRTHVLGSMKDGVTEAVSVGQVVDLAKAEIVGAAPAQLDTLDEIAAALADDANLAATLTAAIALKADASTTNIHSLAAKTTPVDADEIRVADSAAGFGFKKLTFGNLKAWISGLIAFSKKYDIGENAITAGGLVTLTHPMGQKFAGIALKLRCATAELGYSIGDEVSIGAGLTISGTTSRGCMPYTQASDEATKIYIRFGSDAQSFNLLNKSTGTISAITNANWRLIGTAWA